MIVQSIGSGPDLALVHGWGLGRHAWEPVLEALAQRCRVHHAGKQRRFCTNRTGTRR
jgi:pimeloyl-ACP methyl ester carboxylesterase